MQANIQSDSTFFLERISRELDAVPHLKERMAIDLVNGIDVSRNLIAFKKDQTTFSKLLGEFDGSNRRRDIMVEEQFQHSIEALTAWSLDLCVSVNVNQQSIIKLAGGLETLRGDLHRVAKAVLSNNSLIDKLQIVITSLNEQASLHDERLKKLEVRDEINCRIESLMSGRLYRGYSSAIKVAFLIDDLIGGEMGQLLMQDSATCKFLQDKIINAFRELDWNKGNRPCLGELWFDQISYDDDLKTNISSYAFERFQEGTFHCLLAKQAGSGLSGNKISAIAADRGLPCMIDEEEWCMHLIGEAEEHFGMID